MARIAEPEKMNNIKRAAMEALIEHGYGGMSIESISKKAGVSPGYLYRYYKSKEELVQELTDSEIGAILESFVLDINSSSTIAELCYKTVNRLLLKANQEPLSARFTAAVVLDNKIPVKQRSEKYTNILAIADRCIELGINTGEINPAVTAIEVLIVPFTIPFRYLSISLEIDTNKKFTEKEIKRITEICCKAIQ